MALTQVQGGMILASGQSIPKAALPTGSVLQVVYGQPTSNRVTVSSSSFVTVGNGVNITPLFASSRILVTILTSINIRHELSVGRGGNTNITGVEHGLLTQTDDSWMPETIFYIDSPASTSTLTYYLTARGYNGSTSTVNFGDFSTTGPFTYMTLMEIAS